MNEIIKNIEAAQLKETVPSFNVGDTVRVSAKIKEGNRERIQVFEGTVIKRQNGGVRETFTVRKSSNGVGVEKTWPVHSPAVEVSPLCIRICGYVCPARREELCSSFFSCNRKFLVIPYYKKEYALAYSRAERVRLRHER